MPRPGRGGNLHAKEATRRVLRSIHRTTFRARLRVAAATQEHVSPPPPRRRAPEDQRRNLIRDIARPAPSDEGAHLVGTARARAQRSGRAGVTRSASSAASAASVSPPESIKAVDADCASASPNSHGASACSTRPGADSQPCRAP